MSDQYDTVEDIKGLRELDWTWTEIGAHYGVSERQVRRWHKEEKAPSLAPPLELNFKVTHIVNDTQHPHTDRALWEVATQVAKDAGAEHTIWDGDMLDFEMLGRYNHNAYRLNPAKDDVWDFHENIREPYLAETGITEEDWNDGNHEFRFEKYLMHNAPALDFPDPKEFLELPDHVNWVGYGKQVGTMLTPKLLVAHGWSARKWSAYTAKNVALGLGDLSLIQGHTHRVGVFMHTTPQGTQVAYEVGHMCDPTNLPKSMEGLQDWQQVAGTLVYSERDGDGFTVELVPVFGSNQDRVIANNREYRIDRSPDFWTPAA